MASNDRIKINRTNDWDGPAGWLGFLLFVGAVFLFVTSNIVPAAICLLLALGIFTNGSLTIIDIDAGTVVQKGTVFGELTTGTNLKQSKEDFSTVTITYYSLSERREFRVHTTRHKIREYIVTLVDRRSGRQVTVQRTGDYKEAVTLARRMADAWNLELEDVIKKKMKSSRRR